MAEYGEGRNIMPRKHIKLLITALLISLLALGASYYVGKTILDNTARASKLSVEEEEQYINSFQGYVADNNIASNDIDGINLWTKDNPDVVIMLYDKGTDLYRYYNQKYMRGLVIPYYEDSDSRHSIVFSDGTYKVFVTKVFNYNLYYINLFVAIIVAFAVFFTVFFRGINRRAKYIVQLKDEMDLLSSGNLNYEVTVKGNDELAYLADNLNQMRQALLHHIEEEEHLAHDIKTPLTSIMLFAELLEQGKYESEEQKAQYLNRICKGAAHINEITEQLMQHASTSDKPGKEPVKGGGDQARGAEGSVMSFGDLRKATEDHAKASANVDASAKAMANVGDFTKTPAGVDLISMVEETCETLRLSGFEVELDNMPAVGVGDCEADCRDDCNLAFDENREGASHGSDEIAMNRIFENIRSNIMRYADVKASVYVSISCEENNEDSKNGESDDSIQTMSTIVEFRNKIRTNIKACEASREGTLEVPSVSTPAKTGSKIVETSRGIGLKSVATLMRSLGGELRTENDGDCFATRLVFRTLH